MKKFLEELAKHKNYIREAPTNTIAEQKYAALKAKFSTLVGKNAMYRCGSDRSVRVVVIEQALPHYVLMSHRHYGRDYQGKTYTSCPYGALLCGDDRIDVE